MPVHPSTKLIIIMYLAILITIQLRYLSLAKSSEEL